MNNQPGSSLELDPNSSKLMEFKCPVEIYNLGRSYISYTEPVTALATADHSTYVHDNTFEIADRITFGNAGGANLLDLNSANNYIAVARPIDTPYDEFMSNDATAGMYTNNDQLTNIFSPQYTVQANNISGLNPGTSLIASSYKEPMYVKKSVVQKGNVMVRNFPLSGVKHTVIAMDRDQSFGQEMYLRIHTATNNKVAYTAKYTAYGAGPPIVPEAYNTFAAVLSNPKLNNICLHLAVEKDLVIRENIMAKYTAGQLMYQIPSVTTFKNAVKQGGQSIQIQLNNQYGKKLKRVLTTNFNNNELLNTAYDHHNWNGSKVLSYQTFIGSNALQESVLSCKQPETSDVDIAALRGSIGLDDWCENAKHCKNTAITSSSAYQLNWFHADTFNERNVAHPEVQDENLNEGLSLALPISWSIRMDVVPADAINYTFCEFIKDIQITPMGPVVVDALTVSPVAAMTVNPVGASTILNL